MLPLLDHELLKGVGTPILFLAVLPAPGQELGTLSLSSCSPALLLSLCPPFTLSSSSSRGAGGG